MELKFDLNTMSSKQLAWLVDSLDAYRAAVVEGFALSRAEIRGGVPRFHYETLADNAQPEVAHNTGSTEPAPPFTGDPAGETPDASGESAADGVGSASAAPAVTEQKRGRGRPRKETAQESTAPAVEEQAPAESATESAQPITIDDLRAALQVFTAKNGIEAGMPLLAKYNARRISEMVEQPEEAKAAFIKECQA